MLKILAALTVPLLTPCSAAFCEGKFGGGFYGMDAPKGEYYPQYGNGISALFITFVGLHMLVFFDNDSVFFRLVASVFAANGVGSFAFHYFGVWGSVDADTMTLVVGMMTGYAVEEFWESYTDARHNIHSRHERLQRRIPMAVMWLLIITFSFWMTGGATLGDKGYYKELFELTFGVPLVVIAILMSIIIKRDWVNHEYLKPVVCQQAIFRFKLGLLSVGICLPLYFYCERACASSAFAKFFPGHVLWHIAMSWGLLNMLVFVTLLRAQNMRCYPVIYSRQVHGCYFAIFPAYHFEDDEEVACVSIASETNVAANAPSKPVGSTAKVSPSEPLMCSETIGATEKPTELLS